jgi:hypothetical protein
MRMLKVVALSFFVAVPVVAQAQGVPGGIKTGLTAGPIPVTACSGRSAALLAVSLVGRPAVSLAGSTAFSESILTGTTAATIGAELKERPLRALGRRVLSWARIRWPHHHRGGAVRVFPIAFVRPCILTRAIMPPSEFGLRARD